MRTKALAMAALAAASFACNGDPVGLIDHVPAGTWGGVGAQMVVTDSGAGVQFNCAGGHIDGPLTVEADGQFSWSGTYTRVFAAPGSPQDTPHAATYHGTATTSQVSLSLTVPDLALETDPMTLVFGDSGNIALCP